MKRSFKFNLFSALLITFLSSIIALIIPQLKQLAIDEGISSQNVQLLLIMGIIIIILSSFRGLLNYYGNLLSFDAGKSYIYGKYSKYFRQMLNKPMQFFVQHPVGYIAARLDEIENYASFFSPSTFMILGSLIQLIVSIVLMFTMNWKLTVIVLTILPISTMVVVLLRKEIKSSTAALYEGYAIKQQMITQIFAGVKDIKLFNRENEMHDQFCNKYQTSIFNERHFQKVTTKNSCFSNLFVSATSTFILVGCGLLILKNRMTFGEYVQFSCYAELVLAPVSIFVNFSQQILPMLTLRKRIKEFDEELKIVEVEERKTLDKINKICFNKVSFKYPEKEMLYSDISLELNPGDVLQITGANGVGKSTLLSLILKWYDPIEGDIQFNGVSIKYFNSEEILKHIAVLPQNPYIFNESIKENIMMGTVANENKYSQVLSLSNLSGFISSLKEGDQYVLSEAGADISGGQLKKIALARMLLKNSEVMIFDEPFAGLDNNSIEDIKQTIHELRGNKILIIVDHTGISDSLVNKKIGL